MVPLYHYTTPTNILIIQINLKTPFSLIYLLHIILKQEHFLKKNKWDPIGAFQKKASWRKIPVEKNPEKKFPYEKCRPQ